MSPLAHSLARSLSVLSALSLQHRSSETLGGGWRGEGGKRGRKTKRPPARAAGGGGWMGEKQLSNRPQPAGQKRSSPYPYNFEYCTCYPPGAIGGPRELSGGNFLPIANNISGL